MTLLTPADTGVWFTNLLPERRHVLSQILPNGSGVTAADFDLDGWCDLFFCGLRDSGSHLYRNLGGWRFTNITTAAGVALTGLDCTGASAADLDGDGDSDLIVNSVGGGTRLFFNDGAGRFTPAPGPLNSNRGGTSLGLGDADGDGDLDLYIANYRVSTLTDAPGTRFGVKMINGKPVVTLVNGRPLTDPEWTNRFRFKIELGAGGRGRFAHEELGEPDAFFWNDGQGRFTPVPFTSGVFLDENGQPLDQPPFDWGLSVLFRDLDGDGAPDLYLCNDFSTPDRLWLNDAHGRFRLASPLALRQTSLASMAADAADLDRDGHDDLVVLDMLSREHTRRLTQRNIMRAELAPAGEIAGRPQYPRNTLLWNRGDGTYAEIAQYAGIEGSEWSWNPILLDVDLDGFEDLLIPNGFVRDNMNLDAMRHIEAEKAGRQLNASEELQLRALYPPLNTPNLAFRNLGTLRFAECSQAWGFDQPTISQGACLADLDNDGDLDLVVNNLNSVAGIYRNDTAAPRLAVRLRGQPPNTGGIGARVTVRGGPMTQTQQILAGGRYCSSDQGQRTFATGDAQELEVVVRWRSGRETTVRDVPPNRLLEVHEPEGPERVSPSDRRADVPAHKPRTHFHFADASDSISHLHEDALFDDFERQPLLPRKLSQLGPGLAWWDLDADGREDLVVGGGRGGRLAFYRNHGAGQLERIEAPAWSAPLERDAVGLAGLAPGKLLIAWANYEDNATSDHGVTQHSPTGATAVLPLDSASFGPLAVADYDGDDDLDLFLGARVRGGSYPWPVKSGLFQRVSGRFTPDLENNRILPETMISSAIWTDLDGDGWPDLVLACDWGPLRILRNDRGRLSVWNPSVRFTTPPALGPRPSSLVPPLSALDHFTGWWNGVVTGDFDNDGRLDLVAANWGSNTRYERWRPAPLRLYFGDFNQDGTTDLLEAHLVPELQGYAPDRMLDTVARNLPQLAARFPTHAAWARARFEEVLGDWRPQARQVEAVWLESTLFLNRGDHFEARLLPFEAQIAPAFAVCVGDADGDGIEDLFLSQNFFGVDMDTSRSDAGRGLWLTGDGQGNLAAVRGQDSGVRVYGEQRGAALADFDGDGRLDLAVAQNNAATKLFRNTGATPGLRVRLAGPDANPCGIGAVVRLRRGDVLGPAREMRSGSGYWSQDSPILVLGTPTPATAVWVRWSGGRVTEHPVASDTREVLVHTDGRTEVVRP